MRSFAQIMFFTSPFIGHVCTLWMLGILCALIALVSHFFQTFWLSSTLSSLRVLATVIFFVFLYRDTKKCCCCMHFFWSLSLHLNRNLLLDLINSLWCVRYREIEQLRQSFNFFKYFVKFSVFRKVLVKLKLSEKNLTYLACTPK